MRHLLVDTSVLITWFHQEEDSGAARMLLAAHLRGEVEAHLIDLALYEAGNVLTRVLRWAATDVGDQLDDLAALVGAPLVLGRDELRSAASLAEQHGLTFYDAAWAAAAAAWDMDLVTADRRLLGTGLGISVATAAQGIRRPGQPESTDVN